MADSDFATDHLNGKAKQIARHIVAFLKKHQGGQAPDGGGCRAFYTPEQWTARGEHYGCNSLLVLVYDGGDLSNVISLDASNGRAFFELDEELRKKFGVYIEHCTHWYAAVYPQ